MSSQTVLDLVIGLVVLGVVVFRQLQSRPVRANQRMLMALLVVGVIETSYGLQKVHTGPAIVAALAGSLALAAIFGAFRAFTVRIWIQGGQPWLRGSLLTAVLWVVALAAHLGYDYLVGHGTSMAQLGPHEPAPVPGGQPRGAAARHRLSRAAAGPVWPRSAGRWPADVVGAAASLWSAAEGRSPRSLCSELNQAARRIGEASMPTTVRRGH